MEKNFYTRIDLVIFSQINSLSVYFGRKNRKDTGGRQPKSTNGPENRLKEGVGRLAALTEDRALDFMMGDQVFPCSQAATRPR